MAGTVLDGRVVSLRDRARNDARVYGLAAYDQGQIQLPPLAPDGTFRGLSIACVARSREAVDQAHVSVVAAGAEVLHEPSPTPWGGYSFHFLDPEGNLWAITHAP